MKPPAFLRSQVSVSGEFCLLAGRASYPWRLFINNAGKLALRFGCETAELSVLNDGSVARLLKKHRCTVRGGESCEACKQHAPALRTVVNTCRTYMGLKPIVWSKPKKSAVKRKKARTR